MPARCPAPITTSTRLTGWARGFLAQARCHVAVAFGDQRFVQRRRFPGEFAEHAAEEIALLEFLDLILADVFARQQAAAKPADDAEAIEETDAAVRALERDADFAIDQPDRQAARFGAVDGHLHLGAGLDAELLGEPALERRQREIRRDEAGLALADHLEEIEITKRFRICATSGIAIRRARRQRHRRSRARGSSAPLRRWRGETCAVPSNTNSTSPRRTCATGCSDRDVAAAAAGAVESAITVR